MGDYSKIILVTGCARSGTSLVAGSLTLCGASGGKMAGATKHNRKGMFENLDIRNNIVKPILRQMGYDPMGQNPLPDPEQFKSLQDHVYADFAGRVVQTLKKQGCGPNPMYKGAKMCLMWPLWHRAFPGARWVIVRRNPDDIVNSCLRTSFMRGHRTRAGWLGWVADHEKRFEEMFDAKLDVLEVWPQRAINGDLTELQMVANSLELVWDFNKVREFVTPSLWHRAKKR